MDSSGLPGSSAPLTSEQTRSSPASGRLAYPRRRAIRACHLCRARRTKCDNKKPSCSFCLSVGAECITGEGESPAFDGASLKILERIDDLERLLKDRPQPQSPSTRAPPPRAARSSRRLFPTTEDVLSWTVFQGRYSGQVDLKKILQTPRLAAVESPESIAMHGALEELEPASCRRLLDDFFRYIHVKNPMLDESNVRQAVHRMCLEGPTWDAESCLCLLVCALGSIASSFDTSGPASHDNRAMAAAQSYFKAAQKRISAVMGNGGVLEARCLFYSGVYLMSILQPLKAWRFFVQALASCQEFECAKSSYEGPIGDISNDPTALPAEECVYWSCWKSEFELRAVLQLPNFSFDDLAYPSLFPTPPPQLENHQATAWYFYLSEISLRRLDYRVRDEICELVKQLNGPVSTVLYEFAEMSEKLAEEWVQSLPLAMSLKTAPQDDDVLKFILRGQLLNLLEVIYMPFLDFSINQGVQSLRAEAYSRKGLELAVERIRINKPGFHHRHHGTWLMIQACTRSALTLLSAAYRPETAAMLPADWKTAVFDVIELLEFWQEEAADTTNRLQILKELVTDVF